MEAELKQLEETSTELLAKTCTMLGRVEMYRDTLSLAASYRDLLPQPFLDKLIALDPRAKT